MKVDTGLFTFQPIESDPTDRREYKRGVSRIANKKNDMPGFATQQSALQILTMYMLNAEMQNVNAKM